MYAQKQNRSKAIDLNNGKRVCKTCFSVYNLEDFPANGGSLNGRRSDCTKCYNKMVKEAVIRSKAFRNPQDYFICNSCDRTMNVYKGKPKRDGTRTIVDRCKYCGSNDIDDYLS